MLDMILTVAMQSCFNYTYILTWFQINYEYPTHPYKLSYQFSKLLCLNAFAFN